MMTTQSQINVALQELPGGTVTFLFTDIQGSTQLLHQLRDQYTTLLEKHHQIIRAAIERWHGREVDTQGDAFFVAFPKATEAIAAAAEIQRTLDKQIWPEVVQVRVRMGLHTGEPWLAGEGYVGMDVHRAARIAHVGHGGQVLLSEATAALIMDELPDGVSLLDLGRHLLKDIHRPEHIRQLLIKGLPGDFPPLSSLAALPSGTERPAREVGESPYRGLAAFQEVDAPFYFGREHFVDILEAAVRTKPMVAVIVGSSGSGKSSALFAGLLPRLRQEPGWRVATLRPGAQPFYALAGALMPLLEREMSRTDRLVETRKLADRLAGEDITLLEVVDDLLAGPGEIQQLLLVLDQFEELYTLCPDEDQARRFIDQMLSLIEAGRKRRNVPGVILMTMRADFMGQALAYRPWADALQELSLLMGPMNREELRAAIEKPALMQGAAFEAGLVERVLDDVGDKPGNLPLLEFTLTQLWEAQVDGWLTHADYETLGGVEGALACYADQVYEELTEEEQEGARRALVQLIRPGEGTEDTRRVATREELGDKRWALLQHLAGQRLVVTGRDVQGQETAEVVHEALIQRWGRIREWMENDRAFRAWQERLRYSLRQWQESDEDEGALLDGALLSVAQGWLSERGDELSPTETAYIRAGVARQERREQARLEQKQKEEQLLAEQRAARRLRRLAAALAIFIIIAVTAALIAISNARRAEEAQVEADQQRLAAEAESEIRATAQSEAENERDRADQEASAARQAEEEASAAGAEAALEAERAQAAEELAVAAQAETDRHRRIVLAQSLASLGPTVIQSNNDTELATLLALEAANINQELGGEISWITDLTLRQLLTSPYFNVTLSGHPGPVRSVAFSPDGRNLAMVSSIFRGQGMRQSIDEGIFIRDMADANAPPVILRGHTDIINAVAYAPGGRFLASGGVDRAVHLWDLTTGSDSPIVLEGHTGAINALAFSSDNSALASGGDDRSIRLWNPTEPAVTPIVLEGQLSPIKSLAYAPGGQVLASGGADGRILLTDMNDPENPYAILEGHQGSVLALAFSPDGATLASAGADGSVRLWEIEEPGGPPAIIYQGQDLIWTLTFSPDGSTIAFGGGDQVVHLLSLSSVESTATLVGHADSVYSVAFSPDGRWLASGSADYTARLWQMSTPEGKPTILQPSDEKVIVGIFAPDGRTFTTAGYEGVIRVWNASNLQTPATVLEIGEVIRTLAYNPDGQHLVSGGGTLSLWDLGDLSAVPIILDSNLNDISSVAIDRTGNIAAYITSDRLYLKSLRNLTSPPDNIGMSLGTGTYYTKVLFSHDGRTLVSSIRQNGKDQSIIHVWDMGAPDSPVAILSVETRLEGSNSFINDLAFTPDDRILVSGGNDQVIRLWDMGDLEAQPILTEGQTEVLSVAVSPDGKILAAGGADGAIRIWSMADTTAPHATLLGHQEAVRFLAFSPVAHILVSGGDDGTVRVWPTLDGLREIGCSLVRRNLSQEEWQAYLGEEPYRETCP